MKKLGNIFLAAMLLVFGGIMTTSCTDYQDEIDALDKRVTTLEELVSKANSDIQARQVIVSAIEDGDYITDVRQIEGGYLVNFKKYGPIYIMDGVDGKDATGPNITVEQDPTDEQWYWKVDGQWLMVNGNKIRANGKDGKDAVSPQVRINPVTLLWEYTIDGGTTWTAVPGSTTAQAQDGKTGKNGDEIIKSMQYYNDGTEEYVIITTNSGTFRINVTKQTT